MLARVAEAIARQMAEDDNDDVDLARAALQAIRKPDREIVDKAHRHFADPCWPEDATKGFTAMIDAILAEGDKTA